MKIGKLLLALLLSLGLASPALAEIGRIKHVVGTVQVLRDGKRLVPEPGTRLEQGDIVETGANGRIGITFIDNTRFALGPKARIALDTFVYDRVKRTGEFVTGVDRGSLGVELGDIAKSRRDAMKVRTPTSLLGVRGTRFIVRVP